MRRFARLAVIAGLLAGSSPLAAQAPRPAHDTLANGLRVVLVEDHSAPLVTVSTWYHVGSAHERRGATGLAHLFEHLMYQGSANVPAGGHAALVEEVGGEVNATTTEERTAFTQTVPSHELARALWLEADRMRGVAITQQVVDGQREALRQERRMRVDNQAYGGAFLEVFAAPFDSTTCFPYSHPVMGTLEEVDATPLDSLQAFFRRFYTPGNATLVISGDVDPAPARALVDSLFASIPAGSAPPAPGSCDGSPAGRQVERTDPLAQRPATLMAWQIPAHDHADSPALRVLGAVLGGDRSGRLSRDLAGEHGMAVQAGAGVESRGGPGVLYLFAIAQPGVTADSLGAALRAQLSRLATEPVPASELEVARNSLRAATLFDQETTRGLADAAQHVARHHDAGAGLTVDLEQNARVTAADVARVARTHLDPARAMVVRVLPAAQHGHEEDE